jgi:hypothetical protein
MGLTSFAIPQELKDDLATTSANMEHLVKLLRDVKKEIHTQVVISQAQNVLLERILEEIGRQSPPKDWRRHGDGWDYPEERP